MNIAQPLAALALKAVALAVAAASMALIAIGIRALDLFVGLLSIGLFALAVSSIIEGVYRRQADARLPSTPVSRLQGRRRRRR